MATVNFYYRSKKEKSKLTIKLRFSHNKVNYAKTVKTPILTTLYVWCRVHKKNIKDAELRKEVFDLKSQLYELENFILAEYENEKVKQKLTNQNWLEDKIERFYNPNQEIPIFLLDYIDYYLDMRRNEIKPHLCQKLQGLKKKLEIFEKQQNHRYKIEEIDEKFGTNFIDFLINNKYSSSYIKKQLTYIKQVCNHAYYNGLKISRQLKKINFKLNDAPKIYLNFNELELIENYVFNRENLNITRDWLLISAFTGQRISDFMRFNKEMIRTERGKEIIEFTQKKTGKFMTIVLHDKILKILKRNDGDFPKKLPYSKYNKYLKIVCKKAKIDQLTKGRKAVNISDTDKPLYRNIDGEYPKFELISSHVGRRSFATNFYGIAPTTYLINATGHSTENQFLKYIGKSNKDIALELGEYF